MFIEKLERYRPKLKDSSLGEYNYGETNISWRSKYITAKQIYHGETNRNYQETKHDIPFYIDGGIQISCTSYFFREFTKFTKFSAVFSGL